MLKNLKTYFFGANDADELPEAFSIDQTHPPFEHWSDAMNYAVYDSQNQLFYLDEVTSDQSKPTGIGFTIECQPMTGASDEDMTRLLTLFQMLPEHSAIQVLTYGSPNIDAFLNAHSMTQTARGDTNMGRLFQALAEKQVDFLQTATTKTIHTGFPIRLRTYRVVMSVILQNIDFGNARQLEDVATLKGAVITSLKSSGLYQRTWTADELIEWVKDMNDPARMLYHKDRDIESKYDELNPLRDQVVSHNTFIRMLNHGNEIRFGLDEQAVSCRCFSVSEYPGNAPFHLGRMSSLIGDDKQIYLNYPCPFVLCMTMVKEDYERTKNGVTIKAAEAVRRSTQPFTRYMPETAEKAKDWELAQASYSDGAGGVVKVINQVILFDTPENIEASQNTAIQIWRTNGFSLAPDTYLQKQSFLAALPMSMDKDMMPGMDQNKRFTTKTMLNAVSLSPLAGEWTGVGRPILPLFGRNGQAMSFDPFANTSGNYNMAVMGTSGSGKSFALNKIACALLGAGAQGFIIDMGRSYKALCGFVDGQFIEFNKESNLVINPFELVKDIEEDRKMLKLVFSTMCAPISGVNEYQASVIEKIIETLWEEKKSAATIDDLAAHLLNYKDHEGRPDPEINRLGTTMYQFTSHGIYGRWFSGPTNFKFEKELVVIELDDLQSMPDLQKVIVKMMIYMITQAMYGDRNRKKFCLIDEAWNLLDGGKDSAQFIGEGFRKTRKYGGMFITATQAAKDYNMSEAANAAFEHADWIVVLRGKESTVEELTGKLNLSEHQAGLIRSLTTNQGIFSELFIYNEQMGYGVGRLYADPYSQLMSSSKADDFNAIEAQLKQGVHISQAIDAVLQSRTYH